LPKGGHRRPKIEGPGLLRPIKLDEDRITENGLTAKHQNVQSLSTPLAMLLAACNAYKNADKREHMPPIVTTNADFDGEHPVDILAGKMDRQI
ncbi:MAG: hypothetical protein JWQ00_2644, partial [Noviherbaspirillum sp.]|nr:hypothetical protein [Noviherbaspirillum sp.]